MEHGGIGKGEIDLRAIRGVLAAEDKGMLGDLFNGEAFRCG